MKTKVGAVTLAGLLLLTTSHAAPPSLAPTNAPTIRLWDAALVEAHQQALEDLAAKRHDLKARKCKIADVYLSSRHLLNTELAMSSTKEQQVAAFARQAVLPRELESEAADKDKLFIQKWREGADAVLLHVKSLEMSAADLERDQKLLRPLALTQQRSLEEMRARRIRERPRLDLIYPTRPPRFLERPRR